MIKKQAIFLGEFEVVDVQPGRIQIQLGGSIGIWIMTYDFPHVTKLGDKLPLYTELMHGQPQQPPKQ